MDVCSRWLFSVQTLPAEAARPASLKQNSCNNLQILKQSKPLGSNLWSKGQVLRILIISDGCHKFGFGILLEVT